MADPLLAYRASFNEAVATAHDSGFLRLRYEKLPEDGQPRRIGAAIRLELEFAFRDADDNEVLSLPRGAIEPYVIVDQTISIDSGQILQYQYEVVDRERGSHFAHHLHGHGGAAFAHRQGYGVPRGVQPEPPIDLAGALWDLIEVAMAWTIGRG